MPDEKLVSEVPMSELFRIMETRLKPEAAGGVFESVALELGDERYTVTVRRGIAEVRAGEPLPGTPEPVAILRTDDATWRRLAIQQTTPLEAIAQGELEVEGERVALVRFMNRFERGF